MKKVVTSWLLTLDSDFFNAWIQNLCHSGTIWRPDLYHPLTTCHVNVEVRINVLAPEGFA